MSVSYAVDFASLLLIGPNETMLVAAASALSQCTFRIKERNPLHRTLFSMACLVITVQAAGAVYLWLDGHPGTIDPTNIAEPLVGAATTHFLVNTLAECHGDRSVDAPIGGQRVEQDFPVERAELISWAPARRRWRGWIVYC